MIDLYHPSKASAQCLKESLVDYFRVSESQVEITGSTEVDQVPDIVGASMSWAGDDFYRLQVFGKAAHQSKQESLAKFLAPRIRQAVYFISDSLAQEPCELIGYDQDGNKIYAEIETFSRIARKKGSPISQ